MRILLVNEYFAPVGGTEQYLISLIPALKAAGHAVAVLSGYRTGKEPVSLPDKFIHVPDTLHLLSGDNMDGLGKIGTFVREWNPDVIYLHQTHNPYAVNLFTSLRPCVRYFHGFKIACPSGQRTLNRSDLICEDPFSLRCLVRAYTERCMPRNVISSARLLRIASMNRDANRNLARMIVASEYMKRMLRTNGQQPDRVTIIPYFVGIPDEAVARMPPEPGHILFVGRPVPQKGLDYLLRSLKQLTVAWKLTIAGAGEYFNDMANYARELGIADKVSFVGWVDHNRLGEYYANACVVAVPSIWPEPFGIVGIEAMACARPVVAFDVGGIPEWLSDGRTGFLVRRKDEKALAEKLAVLLSDGRMAQAMGWEGRRIAAERFTQSAHMERLLAVLEPAATGK
jgi:glycosyltransferase involved in cell wall biosynthesis